MTDRIPQDAKRVRLAYDDSEGRTVVTDIEVEQRESPFMVVGHDNPEGPSLIARPDGWYPVEVEQ